MIWDDPFPNWFWWILISSLILCWYWVHLTSWSSLFNFNQSPSAQLQSVSNSKLEYIRDSFTTFQSVSEVDINYFLHSYMKAWTLYSIPIDRLLLLFTKDIAENVVKIIVFRIFCHNKQLYTKAQSLHAM